MRVDKDINRTDSSHSFYKNSANIDTLRSILLTYSMYNFDLGYCQVISASSLGQSLPVPLQIKQCSIWEGERAETSFLISAHTFFVLSNFQQDPVYPCTYGCGISAVCVYVLQKRKEVCSMHLLSFKPSTKWCVSCIRQGQSSVLPVEGRCITVWHYGTFIFTFGPKTMINVA